MAARLFRFRLPVPSMLNDLFLLGKLTGLGLVILLPWPIP